MSISSIQNTTRSSPMASAKSRPAETTGKSFAATLSSVGNGTPYADEEVKSFFAGNPTPKQIADKAVALGLTEGQIGKAMAVGGFEGSKDQALSAQIEGFVATAGNGFAWGANGGLTTAKANAQAASAEKVMPAAQDIKAFYATQPTDAQITEKVKTLGLNAAQMVQFQSTGIGMDMSRISAPVLETMFVDAANRLGTDIGGGKNGGWTSYFSPTEGRAVTKSEMQAFFAGNPSQSQIFQKASELGLGVAAVNNMMIGLGITKAQDMNSAYARMDNSLFQGKDSFSLDQFGHIVAGGGKVFVETADRTSGSWEPRTSGNGELA